MNLIEWSAGFCVLFGLVPKSAAVRFRFLVSGVCLGMLSAVWELQ